MNREEIISSTVDFVKEYMNDKEAGHNWWHIERVWNNARYIYRSENSGDLLVIELAALLHDIGDDKIDPGCNGKELVRGFLSRLGLKNDIITAAPKRTAGNE